MRLSLPCFLSLALSLFLYFPTTAQAGDLWNIEFARMETNLHHPGHCQFVDSFSQANTGKRNPDRPLQIGLNVLVRDISTAADWNFDYQPQATVVTEGLKQNVRPALFRQTKDQLLRTICKQYTALPGSLQRQLGFALVRNAQPIERATILISHWQTELTSRWNEIKSIDFLAAAKSKESISIPSSWKRDSYWGFYSDCDRWNVRLRDLELQEKKPWSVFDAIPSRPQIKVLFDRVAFLIPNLFVDRFANFDSPSPESTAEHF